MDLHNIIVKHEKWVPLIDENVANIYEISNFGRIRNKTSKYIMSQRIGNDGYYRINLQSSSNGTNNVARRVSRLVLKAFNPVENSDNLEVHHIDSDILNNNIDNLKWVNKDEHNNITYRNILCGERHPKSIYSNGMIKSICVLLSKGYSVDEIITTLELQNTRKIRNLIRDVRDKKLHRHISDKYIFPEHKPEHFKLREYEVHRVCQLLSENKNYAFIMNDLGLKNTPKNCAIISNIALGKTYSHISSMYSFEKKPIQKRHDDKYVNRICKLIDSGLSTNEIADILNVSDIKSEYSLIRKIRRGEAFRYISKNFNFMQKGSTTIESNDSYYTIDINL